MPPPHSCADCVSVLLWQLLYSLTLSLALGLSVSELWDSLSLLFLLMSLLKAKPIERNWEGTAPLPTFTLGKMEEQEKYTGYCYKQDVETGVSFTGGKVHTIKQ